jgi:hypothetical protein
MFPRWLNKLFPVDPAQPSPEWGRHAGDESGVTSTTFGAAEIAGVRTKLVCHQCNTGWMSDLEARAEPILTPMIRGEHVRLDRADQVLVATWATKTAMVIEPTLSPEHNFTEDHCSIVRVRDHPPASVVVDVAAVEGLIAPMGYWGAKVHLVLGDTPFRDYHFHTVHVGPLVLQVTRLEPPPDNYGTLEPITLPGEVALPFDIAATIFPPKGRRPWPPARVLKWHELVTMTHRGLDMPERWTPPGPHWTE